MKRLSIVLLIVFWSSFSFAVENAGALEADGREAVPANSVRSGSGNHSMNRFEPHSGLDYFMELPDAIQAESHFLARLENHHAVVPLPRNADQTALGGGALFITGSITDGHTSVPGSSTMMLLGLIMIGLSGYGGRKMFKR